MRGLSDRSCSRSPSTRTRSAIRPASMRPRSSSPKVPAGVEVAAASASAALNPAPCSSRSSPWRERPEAVPGLGASVPASTGTPAAGRRLTFSIATSAASEALSASPPEKRLARVWRCIGDTGASPAASSSASSIAAPPMDAVTDSVGTRNTPASAMRAASLSSTSSSPQTWTSPSAPRATAPRACSRVLTCTTACRPSACAAAITAPIVSRSRVAMSMPKVPPSSCTILIQSEPSALRARTQAGASSGPSTVSTATPYCVPCPAAAVASMPAEKRSASSPRASVWRAVRLEATSCGSAN